MAFDCPVEFPDGRQFDTWTCDPWEMAHYKQVGSDSNVILGA